MKIMNINSDMPTKYFFQSPPTQIYFFTNDSNLAEVKINYNIDK